MFRSLTMPTQKFLSIIFDKPSYFIDEEISGQVELNNTTQLVLSEITLSLYLLEKIQISFTSNFFVDLCNSFFLLLFSFLSFTDSDLDL